MDHSCRREAVEINLTEEERALQSWVRAAKTERRKHFRARVIRRWRRG